MLSPVILDLGPMTNLVRSAAAWLTAEPSNDTALRVGAERLFADDLEQLTVGLLAGDPLWTLSGRWYDGLLLQSCLVSGKDALHARGFIVRVETQHIDPLDARLLLRSKEIASFEVRFGDSRRPEGIPYEQRFRLVGAEPAWGFYFVNP